MEGPLVFRFKPRANITCNFHQDNALLLRISDSIDNSDKVIGLHIILFEEGKVVELGRNMLDGGFENFALALPSNLELPHTFISQEEY